MRIRLFVKLALLGIALFGFNALSERASQQIGIASNAIDNITSRN